MSVRERERERISGEERERENKRNQNVLQHLCLHLSKQIGTQNVVKLNFPELSENARVTKITKPLYALFTRRAKTSKRECLKERRCRLLHIPPTPRCFRQRSRKQRPKKQIMPRKMHRKRSSFKLWCSSVAVAKVAVQAGVVWCSAMLQWGMRVCMKGEGHTRGHKCKAGIWYNIWEVIRAEGRQVEEGERQRRQSQAKGMLCMLRLRLCECVAWAGAVRQERFQVIEYLPTGSHRILLFSSPSLIPLNRHTEVITCHYQNGLVFTQPNSPPVMSIIPHTPPLALPTNFSSTHHQLICIITHPPLPVVV